MVRVVPIYWRVYALSLSLISHGNYVGLDRSDTDAELPRNKAGVSSLKDPFENFLLSISHLDV